MVHENMATRNSAITKPFETPFRMASPRFLHQRGEDLFAVFLKK